MIERVHKRFAEGLLRVLLRVERISAKEIPTIRIAAPYHPLIPFPAVSAQPLEMLLHEICRLIFVLKHRGKFPQQLCFTALSTAFDFFKAFLKLLYFLALVCLRLPSPLSVRAFPVWYRDPVAAVVVNLCCEKVHLSPPAGDIRRVTAIPFVLFSCKFLSSEEKFARKKGHSTKERNQLLTFFLLCYALEDNDPRPDSSARGNGAAIFSLLQFQWYRFTANLFFYSIQSIHKSALLFSCTRPFSGACAYYIPSKRKSQTDVRIFPRKIKNFFQSYPQYRRRRGGITNKTYRSFTTKARPPREKRRSASGSARTPFRGGPFFRCEFFVCRPLGNGDLSLPFERLHFC